MNELIGVAGQVQSLCERESLSFCIIGGLALQHWGEARMTRDVDVTVMSGFGGEETIIDAFLSCFKGRLPDARKFALLHRVLLLQSDEGIGIDIALGALPFEQKATERAKKHEMAPGIFIKLCSAEDLIVMKAFASRAQDWIDIEGILIRQGVAGLDWKYVEKHLHPLADAKEEPEIMVRLQGLRENYR